MTEHQPEFAPPQDDPNREVQHALLVDDLQKLYQENADSIALTDDLRAILSGKVKIGDRTEEVLIINSMQNQEVNYYLSLHPAGNDGNNSLNTCRIPQQTRRFSSEGLHALRRMLGDIEFDGQAARSVKLWLDAAESETI